MPNNYTSLMVSGAGANVAQGFNFIVRLNALTYGFQEVSGIETHRAVDYYNEGGVNDHRIMVGMPENQEFSLTFTRGMIIRSSPLISDAAKAAVAFIPNNALRKAAFLALNASDPQEALESGPSLGWIEVYGRGKKMVGLYMFLALGITSWKIGSLDANNSNLLIEEFTLVHTGIERVPLFGGPPLYKSLSGDFYDREEQERDPWESKLGEEDENVKKTLELMEESRNKELKKREEAKIEEYEEKNQVVHLEMVMNAKRNAILQKEASESLEKLLEKMEEEHEELLVKKVTWEEKRDEGKSLAEKARKIAMIRENKWIEASEKLSESIKAAQLEAVKNIKKHVRGLKLANDKARELAKEALDNLSIEISEYVSKKKEDQKEFEKNKATIEQTQLHALVAALEARSAAKAARKVAKELWAKKWEDIKEKNSQEIQENMSEFEKDREKGLEKTAERVADRQKRMEEFERKKTEADQAEQEKKESLESIKEANKEARERFEENKAKVDQAEQDHMKAYEEQRKAKKESKAMAEEAEEMAAEAENTADETEAMVELVSV